MVKKEPSMQDIQKRLEGIAAQLQSVQTDVRHIKDEQRKQSAQLGEIEEVLGAVSRTVDKDALTIIQYGRRITRLERSH